MAKKFSTAAKVGGVAAITALAVGAYMLYGKNGAKNRKALKSWMLKAKAEVLEKVENAKEMTADKYHEVVDTVAKKYAKFGATTAEIGDLVKELKGYSGKAKKTIKKAVKKTTAGAKKVAKKAKR